MDEFIKLAKGTVEEYLATGRALKKTAIPNKAKFEEKKGVFVSMHTKDGKLRGCVGTNDPLYRTVGELIVEYAIIAATKDPRFSPVTKDELPDLLFKVDILSMPELVKSKSELDTQKYGVVVKTADGRKGLLLPDIKGVDTVAQQLEIACQKAGIVSGEAYDMYKFTVERHEEN